MLCSVRTHRGAIRGIADYARGAAEADGRMERHARRTSFSSIAAPDDTPRYGRIERHARSTTWLLASSSPPAPQRIFPRVTETTWAPLPSAAR
jgi:hypothetical protein